MALAQEDSYDDRRRGLSPNRGTGRRTEDQDENREGHGGSGRGSAHTANESRRDRREVDDDHTQRMRVSEDRSRRQHLHDVRGSYSRRRYDDGFANRRHEADDVKNSRIGHSDEADADARASEGQSRHFRHHEGTGRERSPRARSSYHDRRLRHEEEHGRTSFSGYRNELAKKEADKETDRDRYSALSRGAQRNEDELPELFSVYRAKVQSVRPFGLFVRLEGFYKQGLVHLSQLSDHEVTDRQDSDEVKMKAIAAVAGEGDQVWVKVISLKDDGGGVKIGCSLKLVSQSTGKDLDPGNIKSEQQQPKGNRQEIKKVTLDAIYNVVCSRCGGHGHLKTECYGTADKSYELIPEEEADFAGQLPQVAQAQTPLDEVRTKPGFGRGRAMVLPAWMTHGSGAAAPQQRASSKPEKKRKASELPDKISTVEEAMALIAKVKKSKKDKHHRKEHRKHKKDEKSKRSTKEKSSRKDRD